MRPLGKVGIENFPLRELVKNFYGRLRVEGKKREK